MSDTFKAPILRIPKGRGGMGCKRAAGYKRKGLNKISPRRKKNKPVWDLLREYLLDNLIRRHGRPSATGPGTEIMCPICKSWFSARMLQADHIDGRNAEGPGILNPYWAPTNIQFLCPCCHEGKTNPKEGGPDYTDYSAIAHPEWRADTRLVEKKIMEFLGPISGDLKYRDADQSDAILFAIGKLDTCTECGNLKCDCVDEGERPEA